MKIVDVAEFYSKQGGGVRTYIHQKFAAAAKLGHEVVVVAPGAQDATEDCDGGRIIWVKSPRLPVDHRYHMFWGQDAVHRILDAENPDVVEASSPWRGAWIVRNWDGPASKALFMHADPVASYPHVVLDGILSRRRIDQLCSWFWSYLRKLSTGFDVTAVSGDWLAKRFASFQLHHPVAVPFGVDRSLFSPDLRNLSVRQEMLAKCGLGPDAKLLISIGRHHPEKRLGMLIDAVEQANRHRPVGLYIVGDGISRALTERRARSVPQVHLAGSIFNREQLARELASSDALLHGCASETYGLVAAEALYSGVPLIVPDAGGAFDLAHIDYAEVYETGSADKAAGAILNLLKRNWSDMSSRAFQAAEMRIGPPEQHFRQLFDLYARGPHHYQTRELFNLQPAHSNS
ncbi:glycosyltransferase [Govanella unica]|uniref:Glycosyltransferase n=1 Tax=Govanella unica TaxID=2975056 RepID=A0A9X3TYB3_9PROT|nr:glycosyltransferase [Govania unica]MDA5194195.1 glycosyltransferase [Govania unica]